MTTIMILVALAALILFSAGAAEGPYPVPRLGWHQWFFLFLSSSFLGCLFEMGVVWLGTGVLMSRSSLLYGAVSVVWGLGALLMLLILYPLRRYGPGTVFAGGMILGGGFEYLASLLLELTYHRLFWDYSHMPLNLDGRTNLLYAAFWGLAGVVWVYWLTPRLLKLLDKISPKGDGRRPAPWPCCWPWIWSSPPPPSSAWRSAARERAPAIRWSACWIPGMTTAPCSGATRT